MTDQLFTGSYPSDALTEAKQLRAENETLRRDYGLMQIDRNNLRSLLDATETKADELHDKLDDAQSEAKALRARVRKLEAALRECEKSMDVMGGYDGRFTLRKVVRAALQKQEGE